MRTRARQSRPPIEPEYPHTGVPAGRLVGLQSPVEALGLSMRTRNTIRAIGCDTVEDLLEFDLSSTMRGLGRKTREELLVALERAGFRHPAADALPAADIRILERSLERMQGNVDAALGAVAREIRLLRQRLGKVNPRL